jgi:excisionase family DNA binding protein
VDGQHLSLEEAAAKLNVTSKTVVRHVRDGKLRAINIGTGKRPVYRFTVYRFTPADLDNFTKQQEAKQCQLPMSSSPTTRRTGTQSFGSEVIDIAARLRKRASAKPGR